MFFQSLKKKNSLLSQPPPPVHLLIHSYYSKLLQQMNHLSLQSFLRGSLWIQPFSWTDMEVRGRIWPVFERGMKTESITA